MPIDETFGSVAEQYDAPRRRLVPRFDDFYGTAVSCLSNSSGDNPTILDLGAGTGLLSHLVSEAFPQAQIRLIDLSGRMLDVARRRFSGDDRFSFVHADFSSGDLGTFDSAVSALAIHHLSDTDKRALFERLFNSLPTGGRFINAEQVAGQSPAETRQLHLDWEAECRALGSDEEELAGARLRMQEDQLATLDDQLDWLREAGFVDVECSFRHGMFAVYRATRP